MRAVSDLIMQKLILEIFSQKLKNIFMWQRNKSHQRNLNEFNFSNTDVRGADFTNAKLVGANFTGAKLGLSDFWIIVIANTSIILAVIAGVTATLLGAIVLGMWQPTFTYLIFNKVPYVYTHLPAIIITIFLFVYLISTVLRGYLPGLLIVAIGLGLTSVLVGTVADALHRNDNWYVLAGTGTGAFVIAMAVITVLSTTIASGLFGAIRSPKKSKKRTCGVIMIATFAMATLWIGEFVVQHNIALVIQKAKLQDFSNWFDIAVEILRKGGVGALNVSRALVAFVDAGNGAMTFAVISSCAMLFLGCYAGWCALEEDENFQTPQKLIVRILSLVGTDFSGSDLTDADFSVAELRGVNFSKAKSLKRTNWSGAKGLDLAYVGSSYLNNKQIRNLLVEKNGRGKKFNYFDLRELNLAGAELTEVSFEGTDLSEANLQNADLERAKLLHTNLRAADLTRAKLTGAFIQDCTIVGDTVLDDVECDYFFSIYRDSSGNNDQGRKPDNEREIFTAGGFADFIRSTERTLDLFHDVDIDPIKIAIALNQLMTNHPESEIEFVGIERKGKNDDKLLLRLKLAETANRSQLHAEYFSEYEQLRSVEQENSLYWIEKIDPEVHAFADVVRMVISSPDNLEDRQYTEDFSHQIGKRVTLTFISGSYKEGFKVTLKIAEDGGADYQSVEASLPNAIDIKDSYEAWQIAYSNMAVPWRLKILKNQVNKSVSTTEDCLKALANLKNAINQWLDSATFSEIREILTSEENLATNDVIRFVIQTSDRFLRQLPWYLWDWFDKYKNAEPVLSPTTFKRPYKGESIAYRNIVRILPVIGDRQGLNLEADAQLLGKLPNTESLKFQIEKTFAELESREIGKQILFDERGWDFLYFAGHSSSHPDGDTGWLKINPNENLDIQQIDEAIRFSLERGLKLVFFNSCDGLGLENRLAQMNIPQIIVMREPIPDLVAQQFLREFLVAFAIGRKPLHIAVRRAREALKNLEDEFPCASILPLISQNLAMPPLLWHELHGATQVELKRCLNLLQESLQKDPYLLRLDPTDAVDRADIWKQIETLIDASKNINFPEYVKEARKAIYILDAIQFELPQDSNLRKVIAQTLPRIKEALNFN